MQKIPTLFERDETAPGRPVLNIVRPECQWVLDGKGWATRKMDGTNVKVEDGKLFKRVKLLTQGYSGAGYLAASRDNPADKWIIEAHDNAGAGLANGIYEAIGPKIQGNPEEMRRHTLIRVVPFNPCLELIGVPRTYDELLEYLSYEDIEGVVFHHPDGRMAKIKKRDFGLTRKPEGP